eukprot:9987347-Alexandrium_andersonii.AAC.1
MSQQTMRSFAPLVKLSSRPKPEGRGPSTPNGSNDPLCGSETAKVGDPHSAGPGAEGAALRAAPPASSSEGGVSPTFAVSRP